MKLKVRTVHALPWINEYSDAKLEQQAEA